MPIFCYIISAQPEAVGPLFVLSHSARAGAVFELPQGHLEVEEVLEFGPPMVLA